MFWIVFYYLVPACLKANLANFWLLYVSKVINSNTIEVFWWWKRCVVVLANFDAIM